MQSSLQGNSVRPLWKSWRLWFTWSTGMTNAACCTMRRAAKRGMPPDAACRETRLERFKAFKIYRFLLMDRENAVPRAHPARISEKGIFWTSNPKSSPVEAAKQAGFHSERIYSRGTAGGKSNGGGVAETRESVKETFSRGFWWRTSRAGPQRAPRPSLPHRSRHRPRPRRAGRSPVSVCPLPRSAQPE